MTLWVLLVFRRIIVEAAPSFIRANPLLLPGCPSSCSRIRPASEGGCRSFLLKTNDRFWADVVLWRTSICERAFEACCASVVEPGLAYTLRVGVQAARARSKRTLRKRSESYMQFNLRTTRLTPWRKFHWMRPGTAQRCCNPYKGLCNLKPKRWKAAISKTPRAVLRYNASQRTDRQRSRGPGRCGFLHRNRLSFYEKASEEARYSGYKMRRYQLLSAAHIVLAPRGSREEPQRVCLSVRGEAAERLKPFLATRSAEASPST